MVVPSGVPDREADLQFRRTSSKIQIFIIFIPEHGIHGIDSLIQKH